MTIISDHIKESVSRALKELYQLEADPSSLTVSTTKPEFEGDYTLVLFSFIKQLKKSPEQLGEEIGNFLVKAEPGLYNSWNLIKGFLNLNISDNYWLSVVQGNYANPDFARQEPNDQKVMVEYSSPNTNKPLHMGHLRNNFLGWSVAQILKFAGYQIYKTCISNDRGIHICKSMVAWKQFADGATPESTGLKGDHFVGDYYVLFGTVQKKQMAELIEKGLSKEDAEKQAPIMKAAQEMLVDWENGVPDVIDLWKKMNAWVYKGFEITYKRIGSDFDKTYYESNTYLLGKKAVEEGLAKKVFVQKEDGSVWIDLTADGLDEKVVQRKDGTAVYITQDIGLAQQKQEEFGTQQSIYVVADEQNYHFKVLKLICEKLNIPGANGIYHLSYGMVELPTGRMKTREGTVVDADDLIEEMVNVARNKTEELGKVKDFTVEELKELYDILAIGALKFFLLRVDPKKRMIFNPEESIDFHGFTGPFVQYTHARIRSILRKSREELGVRSLELGVNTGLLKLEKALIVELEQFPTIISQAVVEHNPSVIAIYVFNLAKTFNTFYSEHSVMNAESEEKKLLRLHIAEMTSNVISSGMGLLGIRVPERM